MDWTVLVPAVAIGLGLLLAVAKVVVYLTPSKSDDESLEKVDKIITPILEALRQGKQLDDLKPKGDEEPPPPAA